MKSRRQKKIRKQIQRKNTKRNKQNKTKRVEEKKMVVHGGKGREGRRRWLWLAQPRGSWLVSTVRSDCGGCVFMSAWWGVAPPPHALGTSGYVSPTQLLPDFCIPLCKDWWKLNLLLQIENCSLLHSLRKELSLSCSFFFLRQLKHYALKSQG